MEKNRINLKQDKMKIKDQENIEVKLLSPLAGDFFAKDESNWDDSFYGDCEYLDGKELARYEDAIRETVDRENDIGAENGTVCNLMEYFYGSEEIKEKVTQAVVSIENMNGILYGCTTLQAKESLEPEELRELCEYITGQYSDGWGEGFEQWDIQTEDGILNVRFWQGETPKFQIQTVRKNETAVPPEKEETHPQGTRPRPKMPLLGRDGNIFP